MKLRRVKIHEVKGLEPLVVKHIQDIEEGMTVLDHQLSFTETERPDVLAVGKDGALCILELKSVSAGLEVLSQILRYLEWATLNVALIARAFPKVQLEASIRLFVVAPAFSEDLVRIIKYMEAELTLIRATCVSGSGSSDVSILLEKVEIESAPDQAPMRGVEDIVGYISDPDVKKMFEKVRNELIKLGVEIRPYKGGKGRWLECWYKEREIGYFNTRKKFLRCQYYIPQKDDFIRPVKFDSYKDWEMKLKKHFVRYMKDIDQEA